MNETNFWLKLSKLIKTFLLSTKRLFETGIYNHWIHCKEDFIIHFSVLTWNEVKTGCEECVTSLHAISIDIIKIWWEISLPEFQSLFIILMVALSLSLFIFSIEIIIHYKIPFLN